MWVAKFSMIDEKGIFSWRNKKFKVKTYAYRTNYFIKGKKSYASGIILVEGKKENVKKFIESLKKEKFIKKLEVKGNLINCLVEKPTSLSKKREESIFYSLELIHIKPLFTDENGVEFWELGSWDRRMLNKILKTAEKSYKGKLIYFKNINLSESDFLFFSLYPKLTQKQKQAFLLALHNGYYEFPRKIELKQLAKTMKISYTAYQFHLRNAEKKIMSSIGLKI